MESLISQVSLGHADSTASLSQLEQEELQWGARNWLSSMREAEGGPSAVRGRKPDDLGGSLSLEDLDGALNRVSHIVREAIEAKAAAEEEAREWRRRYELECGRVAAASQAAVPAKCADSIAASCHGKEIRPPASGSTGNAECSSLPSSEQRNGEPETSWKGEGCCGREEVNSQRTLQSCRSLKEIEFGIGENNVGVSKAAFHLAWGPAEEALHRHRHDIVSFQQGSISSAVRGSRQIHLLWDSPPRRALLVTKPASPAVRDLCARMVAWLREEHGIAAVVEPNVLKELRDRSSEFDGVETWNEEQQQDLHKKVDLAITLGGDGTVLWAASLFRGPVPPLISFACGSLGFMTPFSVEDFPLCLTRVIRGPLCLTLRNRLRVRIVRRAGGEEEGACTNLRSCPSEDDRLVLNEVAIDRGMSSALTNLDCFCDGLFVTSVQGDGLILSTTSGSTAYSLAAGGSMVHPEVPGILFTPICPHSLSFRPLILPEHVTLRVQVPAQARGQAWVSFDGRDRQALQPGDAVVLQMSAWPLPAACDLGSTADFLRGVNESLHWNLRKPQGPPLSAGPPAR